MTVLMTYHKLVERETNNVDKGWKASAIIFLLVAIVCSIVGTASMQMLTHAFEGHCILNASLKFESIKNDTNAGGKIVTSSTELLTIQEFFSDSQAPGASSATKYPSKQLEFIKSQKIDDRFTDWGKHSSCEFVTFIPAFQCCFAIVFMVMFVICSKGGDSKEIIFLPKPWRIVLPALVFFFTMSVLSSVNLAKILRGLQSFCNGFKENMSDVDCSLALDYFALVPSKSIVTPSVFYFLLIVFSSILLAVWLILTLIMIARILFVVDFQLIKITVRTCETENAGEPDEKHIKMFNSKKLEPSSSSSLQSSFVEN